MRLKELTLTLVLSTLLSSPVWAASKLYSGPMVGATSATQSRIWVQTDGEANLQIKYWPAGHPEQSQTTTQQKSDASAYYSALIMLPGLKPDTTYEYRVLLDQQEVTRPYATHFKTPPAYDAAKPFDISFALGSCFFTNDQAMNMLNLKYGDGLEIMQNIAKRQPDLMLWLGDNVYLLPQHFSSTTNMAKRYRNVRTTKEMLPLMAQAPQYATWDDHDFGPNNGDSTFKFKDESLRLFTKYWANDSFGTPQTPGIFSTFERSDVGFFLMDNRYHRAPNGLADPGKPYFGPEQMAWLKKSLKASSATFKLIALGSSVVGSSESYELYTKEYQELLNFLTQEKITGVVFLSGDLHYADLLKIPRKNAYTLYNFMSSPLSSTPSILSEREKNNPDRVPGTLYQGRNFGWISTSGPKGQRVLTLETYSTQGELIWRHALSEGELR